MRTLKYLLIFVPFTAINVAATCNADNCLRAFRRANETASSFCAVVASNATYQTPSFVAKACPSNQVGEPSVRIASACACLTHPTATSIPSTTAEPCAVVSASWAAQVAASPKATPTVKATLAYECLNSVPLHLTEAVALVEQIEPYIEWQSDTAYLKDPPSDYFYPPFDVYAKLASIKTKLQTGAYANEYQFQADLYQITALSHDGHFYFYADLITKALAFGRQIGLVSISSDGHEIPQIFVYQDIISSPATASVLLKINDIDAATYVADWAFTASFNQDADAAYNTMFYSKPFEGANYGTGYFQVNGRMRYIYPGPVTSFTFANGTKVVLDNIAYVRAPFTNVTDGESFYYQFCTGPIPGWGLSAVGAVDPLPVVPGYPNPVITTGDSLVSGYYLNGSDYEDVAVISLLSFENESPVEFQQVAQQFFAQAVAAGKKKLVIDLSGNGGGYILQGFDLFRQLFPDIVQQDYTRFRENEYLLAIARIFSDAIPAGFNVETSTSDTLIADWEGFFNWRYDYNFTEQPFPSFAAKFDPNYYKGDPYTALVRWNFNDPLKTSNSTWGFGTNITGYGDRTNFTQPFAAENIIMLYDGYCASTCTLFSEFMRLQGGVKSIAMGGRPNRNPIQAVGGVKGAQSFGYSDIYGNAQVAIHQTNDSAKIALLNKLTSLPQDRSSAAGVNLRDNILPGNVNDGLPAQFVVEEADCRLYYTHEMVTDVTAMWKGAARAAWNGGSCVAGPGLGKRGVSVPVRKRKVNAKLELAIRREALKAMEADIQKNPLNTAKFGKKVVP